MRALLAAVLVAALWPSGAQTPVPAPPDPAILAFVAAESVEAMEEVLARYPALGADQTSRQALSAEANRMVRAGDYRNADRVYRSMGWLGERIGEPRLRATAIIGRATVAGQTGDLTTAEAHLREAIAQSEPSDPANLQPALNNLGIVLRQLGDLDGALASYERALALAEAAGRPDSVARTLNNIAIVQFNRGNARLAHEYFTRSLALRVDDGGIGTQDMATSLLNIGMLYAEQGDYQQALDYYQRALALWERVGGAGLATVLNNLGHLHASRGQSAAALDYYNRGMAMALKGNERQRIATLSYNLGNLSRDAGRLDDAEALHRNSLAIREETGQRLGTIESLTTLAAILNHRGNAAAALPLATRAVDLAVETRLLNQLWRAQTALAMIRQALGQGEEAAAAYRAALATIEQLRDQSAGGERSRQLYFSDRLEPYYGLAAHLVAGKREAEAFRVVEQARARGLLDLLAGGRPVVRSLSDDEQARERRLVQTLVSINAQIQSESSRRAPDRDRLRELDAALARARLARDAFTTEIYSAHPDLRFGRGEAPIVALADTAGLLRPGTAIVEYVVEADRVWAYVLRAGSAATAAPAAPRVTVVRLPVAAPDLRRQAVMFAGQVASRNLGFARLASSLYDGLVRPLEPHLEGVTRLVLVPDGPLWRVPFQALRSPRGYLIEERAVSYAPSVSALHALNARRQDRLARRGAAPPYLVAFGDPAVGGPIGTLRTGTPARLPEAAREVRALGEIYGADRSAVLTDREATEPRLRELASRASLLHVATHGVLDDKSPMYSYLALAPVQGSADIDADGRLEAWELMGMDLRADLAVLSACETARGEIGDGEGVIGLSWSLFAAGATTAAVSLWEVDSASTTELMIAFHRELAKGAEVSPAMRAASLAHIKSPQFRHPFYWAGFSIIGAP